MKIVLFDRDGTVIVDPPDERVTSEAQIELFPDSLSALQKLARAGFSAIFITNQAGIAEGRLTPADFERINQQVIKQLEASGIRILRTYMCPHGPGDGCACRKPQPTMLLEAARDFDLDLSSTFMIGDHRSDILAGQRAGAKTILVKTANVPETVTQADFQAADLTAAVDHVIATQSEFNIH